MEDCLRKRMDGVERVESSVQTVSDDAGEAPGVGYTLWRIKAIPTDVHMRLVDAARP